MNEQLYQEALDYHKYPTPGKIEIVPTKRLSTQRDLALAYSPGVAAACEEIEKDPLKALDYTARGNLVAVISNGTAVLGLGAIGALASKPVMEGKAVLFKKFANIDSIDIEVDETDVDKLVDCIAALEPSFGGINLEDIKAPECFAVEEKLRARMKIPVFHDDQHGTAIIVTAAFLNWLHFTGKNIKKVKLVGSGAGASAIACLRLLHSAGLPKENIIICDRNGVVYKGRNQGMDPAKEEFANDTKARTIEEAIKGADIFLGLSGPGAISKEAIATMVKDPLVMALANPTPEILPEEVLKVRPQAIICTGRSDYTNQVNNVLCFPFIFRGALDVGATAINEEMKLACVKAIADLARKEVPAEVAAIYSDEVMVFGSQYLIPKPFDPRLIVDLPIAVAKAAMATGVAARPITDFEAYADKLKQHNYRTNILMSPIFSRAKSNPQRVVYCEGEDERVLQALQTVVDENLAKPIIIGRRHVVETRMKRLHLRAQLDKDIELVDPDDDPRFRDYWSTYHQLMERKGVTEALARQLVRTNTTIIGALMVHKNEADAVVCGTVGRHREHLSAIVDVIGLKDDVETAAAMAVVNHSKGLTFICDTHVNPDPSVAQIVESTLLAAEEIRRMGVTPKIAMLSHSNFGTHMNESACKMRRACEEVRLRAPDLEIDGEMHADTALSEDVRKIIMPNSTLKGEANLLMMPNMDAANIAYNLIKIMCDGVAIGPLLLGVAKPAHILTPVASVRGIINITGVAAVGAQMMFSDRLL